MSLRLVAPSVGSAWLIAAALAASSVSVSRPALADEAKPAEAHAAPTKEALREAGQRYDRGLRMYQDSEYALAVIEFERAYSLVPDYRVLYNIGQVRIQLGNYARARRALEQYLRDGGKQVSADRRTSVEGDLEMLAARTATLDIKTNADGADILLDGNPVGQAPLAEPLLLDAGEHSITVQKAGYQSRASQLTLAGRDEGHLQLDLEKVPVVAGQRVIVEKVAAPETDRKTWIWATWAATGAFAIGAGVTEGLGVKAANELDDLRGTPTASRSELDSSSRRARTLLTVGDVLGGLAIASAGVALYVTLSGPSENKEKPAAASGTRVGFLARPGFVGISGVY
jgi:hypothetical protein